MLLIMFSSLKLIDFIIAIFCFRMLVRGCYFQEGEEVKMEMSVENAYHRAIETVVHWIDTAVNPSRTQVFFRTYAPVHFRFVWLLELTFPECICPTYMFLDDHLCCIHFGRLKYYLRMMQRRGLEEWRKLSPGNTT